jgi:hypothetical protein
MGKVLTTMCAFDRLGMMTAGKCTVCNSGQRREIDKAILEGKALAVIAKQYGIHYASLTKHRNNHLSAVLQDIAENADIRGTIRTLDRLAARGMILDTLFRRDKNIGAAKVALDHDTVILKANGALVDKSNVEISGQVTLTPGDIQDTLILDYLKAHHPAVYDSLIEYISQQSRLQLTDSPTDSTTSPDTTTPYSNDETLTNANNR